MTKRWFNIIIGAAISLLALYFAFVGVDYQRVWASLVAADGLFVTAALLSVLLNNWAKAVRWKLLMGERGAQVPLTQALRLHLVGQMLNHLLPARAGDLSRIYMAGELGIAKSFILGTVAIEKVIDMVCYVLIFCLLLLLMPLPDWVSQPAYLLVLLTSVTLLVLVGVLLTRGQQQRLVARLGAWLPVGVRERVTRLGVNLLASLQVLADSGQQLRLVGWSLLIWLTAALTNYWTFLALGLELSLVAAIFLLFVLVAGINIPSAPGRIGLFQYLCILSLAVFGVAQEAALSVGVLLHGLVYLPPIVAGLTTLWLSGQGGGSMRLPVAKSDE
ncbi:lysylphosphatidylglycerol synthase transmembrane domain-containing protein [Candidatus Viridilinea mediisalina]|uniref:TIGR00374 family protein n=1 Tax=Candidatus Viridilinea mediisalina TaxID=2024553 RepID=A0A2A6RL17_9CHLR|nr:lysylphosphatidylglycerol synthase transmembrane domain-containing protein [Candidatus Viridilinea mediisalina]PDW03596.1 hypothetical protein CJ255_07970 [Candidatus Viridilinea mediisalina]